MSELARYADWMTWFGAAADRHPDVRVVLVNGSAVTGGFDDWSDLDVEVLCTPGESVEVYRGLVDEARSAFPIEHVWELPEATWPDGRQCFLHLQGDAASLTEPVLIIDLHVHDLTEASRHVDTRRDGEPIVLHDRHGLVVLRDEPEERLRIAHSEAVEQIRNRRRTAGWLVNRAIARGQLPEALAFYTRFALEPTVRLVRIRHTPARHDFGLRYLDADLPAPVAGRVEALLPLGTVDLAALADDCFAWQDELLEELA